jgi:hypothetical protein
MFKTIAIKEKIQKLNLLRRSKLNILFDKQGKLI